MKIREEDCFYPHVTFLVSLLKKRPNMLQKDPTWLHELCDFFLYVCVCVCVCDNKDHDNIKHHGAEGNLKEHPHIYTVCENEPPHLLKIVKACIHKNRGKQEA